MKSLILAAVLSLSVSAFAKVAKVEAATNLKLDTAASSVEWKAFKKLGSSHNGTIKLKSGEVEFKKDVLVGGTFVVDMSTIADLDLAPTPDYQKKLVGHLSSEDFFNVAKFPESILKIKSATKSGKDQYAVKADLTMIGNTQPVEFTATVKMEKGAAEGTTTLKLDRTKWGLKYGSGNFFKELAADKIINDEFELTLKLKAAK